MSRKWIIPVCLAVLCIPSAAFANFAVTFTGSDVLFVLPFIVMVELTAVAIVTLFILKADVRVYTILVAVFVANLITAAVGTAVDMLFEVSDAYAYVYATLTPTYNNTTVVWIIIAFVLSLMIEWRVYVRFFRKSKISDRNMFRVSLVGNTLTFLLIAALQ